MLLVGTSVGALSEKKKENGFIILNCSEMASGKIATKKKKKNPYHLLFFCKWNPSFYFLFSLPLSLFPPLPPIFILPSNSSCTQFSLKFHKHYFPPLNIFHHHHLVPTSTKTLENKFQLFTFFSSSYPPLLLTDYNTVALGRFSFFTFLIL